MNIDFMLAFLPELQGLGVGAIGGLLDLLSSNFPDSHLNGFKEKLFA